MNGIRKSLLTLLLCCPFLATTDCAAIAGYLDARRHIAAEPSAAVQILAQDSRVDPQAPRQEHAEHLHTQEGVQNKEHTKDRELAQAPLPCGTAQQYQRIASPNGEPMHTQLGLGLDQKVDIGQLQVNANELQKLLTERERDHADRMRTYNQLREGQPWDQLDQWKQTQMPECTCQFPPAMHQQDRVVEPIPLHPSVSHRSRCRRVPRWIGERRYRIRHK